MPPLDRLIVKAMLPDERVMSRPGRRYIVQPVFHGDVFKAFPNRGLSRPQEAVRHHPSHSRRRESDAFSDYVFNSQLSRPCS
jgi:hypothetical protein